MPEKLEKPEITETIVEPAKPIKPMPVAPTGTFATDFFKAAGIVYCHKCGEKRRTNELGVFCPQSQSDCPML